METAEQKLERLLDELITLLGGADILIDTYTNVPWWTDGNWVQWIEDEQLYEQPTVGEVIKNRGLTIALLDTQMGYNALSVFSDVNKTEDELEE